MPRTLNRLLFMLTLLSVTPLSLGTTLKIATIAPNGTTWMKEFTAAANEVASATDSRVQLRFYPGGIMGNDQSVLRKMRVGQLHGGALSGGALNRLYNGVQVYSLPFLFRNHDEVTLIRKTLDPVVKAELKKKGLVVLGISQGGFAHLFSDKPIRRINDLHGQKVWVPDDDLVTRRAFEIAGVSPIPLPVADVYTGLQTGLLNTVGINPTGAVALQWHTKVGHMVDRPLMFLMGFLVVDEKAFAAIAAPDQAIVEQSVSAAFARLDVSNRLDNEAATNAMLGSGIELVRVTEDDYRAWESIASDALDELAAKDVYAVDLLQSVRKVLHEYRGNAGG